MGGKRAGVASNASAKKTKSKAVVSAGVSIADAYDADEMPLNLLTKQSTPTNVNFYRESTKMKNLLAYRSSEACKKACMIISV